MDRAALGQLYRSESRDYLDALGRTLRDLERGDAPQDAVDEAFRLVHTLKGMSAAMGYQSVATLAHGVEHLLDRLRSGLIDVDGEMVDLLYQAVDQLEQVIERSWAEDVDGSERTEVPEAATEGEPQAVTAEDAAATRLVRVEQQRIDRLVDRASELIVTRERLLTRVRATEDDDIRDAAEEMGREIAELRDDVFRLRLAPLGEVFERLHRLVRDTARGLEKNARLEVRGEHVELDRALIGDLADLLTHLLRNALDHGIEPPEERAASGKEPVGVIRLSASADPETISVRVEDDGRGIDLRMIARRAIEAGLRSVEAGDDLGADELFDLLTRPGFTTARSVTEVSGRGVGLDRVASRLRELGGNLEIESEPGTGAVFTLRLPKTLALTRVLLIACGTETVAIPTSAIERVEDYGRPATSRDGDDVGEEERGTAYDLTKLLGLRRRHRAPTEGFVVVLGGAGRRQDLLVDGLIGLRDVVVKRFAVPRQVLDLYAGASILSDGRPCLILRPGRLLSIPTAAEPLDPAVSISGATSS